MATAERDEPTGKEVAVQQERPRRGSAEAVDRFRAVLEESELLKEQVASQQDQLSSRQAIIEELRQQLKATREERDRYMQDAFSLMAVLTATQALLSDGLSNARQDLRGIARPPRSGAEPAAAPKPEGRPEARPAGDGGPARSAGTAAVAGVLGGEGEPAPVHVEGDEQ